MPDAQIIPFDGGASRAQRTEQHAPIEVDDAADPTLPTEPVVATDEGITADADADRRAAGEAVTVEAAVIPPQGADKPAPRRRTTPGSGRGTAGTGRSTAGTGRGTAGKGRSTAAKGRSASGTTAAGGTVKKVAVKKAAGAGRGTASGNGAGRGTASANGRAATPKAHPAKDDAAGTRQAPTAGPEGDVWDRRVAGALAFLRRRLTGEYETDEFGFDPEFATSVLAPALRPIYEKWFRVEISGLEHISDTGGALVVANHSGTIPVDATMLQLGLLDRHPAHRNLRLLGADLVFQMPFVGELARKSGSTLACQPDAERLLSGGELVGVFPEGFKGVGKPFSERYKLQRFGRGGFVSAALATKAPIIPCAIVGAEEIYPKIGDAKVIARMFGLPYFPLTPTFPWLGPLGVVPLPSKWYIQFGEPIETSDLASGADDPMQVFNLTDQVRETIQQMLYQLLMRRRSVFG
ncbi:lysophospholipid acyltransferase family protein [Cryptosporangium aurantiacum]|uniref:1-acyl-sn-glycerol-3-phosphate acyltransferase n=1 Tax=Cryptosporangium aurantiacum TaxID=134849 RepID=A0A1M7RHJ4_9ACTN|nr:lysophospholipid acyltransferase family protein [Cryptosporangium aurantiacum]SHN45631.1 1-acyl-sn-glycerol-3-phosphate acyltransferase [Cryptosporangium aurantiacum]